MGHVFWYPFSFCLALCLGSFVPEHERVGFRVFFGWIILSLLMLKYF